MWRGRVKLLPPASRYQRLKGGTGEAPAGCAQENPRTSKFHKKEPGSVTTPRPSLYSLSTSQPMPAHLQARQLKATQRQAA